MSNWKISPLNSSSGIGVLNVKNVTQTSRLNNVNRRRRKKKRINPDVFKSVRDVVQCHSQTLKKIRCKKRTAKTKKCWIHLGKEDNLRIKKSLISGAGEGLFSYKKKFNRNKLIAKYTGEKVTRRDINRKYGKNATAPYALCNTQYNTRNTICRDAFKTTDGAPRYANDGRKSKKPINSFLQSNFTLVSSKKIRPNQEILTDYGKNYWK